VSEQKEPIDLKAVVQARLDGLTFLAPLRLEDVSDRACSNLGEGTSASYSQGVRLNESVGIFLNWWGWARPHKRYSFAVFEQVDRRWSLVASRIEDIDEALVSAIRALAEHALRRRV
jgi:hypothetical protein